MKNWNELLKDLDLYRKRSAAGGGQAYTEKQHLNGKLTARERVDLLFDKDSFVEIDGFIESRINDYDLDKKKVPGDGIITGYGEVNGRLTFAYSEDFTVMGGTLGEYHSYKICRIIDMAMEVKAPLICINDSGGARIEEGVLSLSGYGGMFLRHTKASGIIPQIAVILGPCAGGACYAPAICDFIFVVNDISKMFITGPDVVKSVTGEEIKIDELGGAKVHSKISGVAHFRYEDELECFLNIKRLLTYLPQSCLMEVKEEKNKFFHGLNNLKDYQENSNGLGTSCKSNATMLIDIVPDNRKKPYDMHKVLDCIVDSDSFMEIQKEFAENIIIGLARMKGESVGFVCNQPIINAGALDCDTSDKAARFVRFCDCFNIPIITLVDVPAFFPGKKQEHMGIIRHGAKLLYAYSEANVPKITLILRKAYGGAYIAMNSMEMGADLVYAWPTAEIAVMGAEGAVDIICKKKIKESNNPDEVRENCIREYEKHFLNPYIAASRGIVTEVIKPDESRSRLLSALKILRGKSCDKIYKKHGNIPL